MPNLVGIGNSQVPTNAMLGGLAYQDPAHANLTEVEIENIAAIKAKTSDTAVDIFVYDTRKDSDGGAWRHRTQHTSWYNEGASAVRGARKEFPAVALIVAVSNSGGTEGVTSDFKIYDGDDPNFPMWMDFRFKLGSGVNTSVTALNGKIVLGATNNGVLIIDFISDTLRIHNHAHRHTYSQINPSRLGRTASATIGIQLSVGGYSIVSEDVKNVAMTILPNAPIDDATGLPIPTIIVGTEGGVSVLKDDGKVFDLSGFSPVTFVAIEGEDLVAALGGTTTHDFIFKTNLPSIDEAFDAQITVGSGNYYMNSNSGTTPLLRDLNMTAMSYNPSDGTVYRGGDNGFDIITKPRTVSNTSNISLISYVDTDYNSGYMVGDIKGAWLSSTDDTNISADTLQDESHSTLDSTFATSNGWSHGSSWSISGGVATCDGGSDKFLYPNANTFAEGTSVAVEVTVTAYTSGTLNISFDTGNADAATAMTATGTYYHVGTCTGNQIVYIRSSSFVGSIDNVKMYIAEADRSKNNKGIAVAGTITKTKVATGSDLVYYSGSSATNFLRQSYNSDLNFGTGDFSIFVWAKVNSLSTNHYIIDRAKTQPTWGGNTGRAYFIINSSGYHRYKLAGGSEVSGTVRTVPTGVFNHIGFVRVGGDMQFWLNGELVETITGSNASNSFDNGVTTQTTTINRYADGFAHNYTFDAMALLRISGSAPSAEQIIKMYDDEKLLFTPNAKCTLSGATSAVKALGFDDTNNTLHVGTLSGRSDFCGLNRINNKTTAVTTAISASNGLVAEQ